MVVANHSRMLIHPMILIRTVVSNLLDAVRLHEYHGVCVYYFATLYLVSTKKQKLKCVYVLCKVILAVVK